MAKYRGRLEIIADVLDVVKGGAKKTRIMYQANLSYKLLIRYLKDVIDTGLARKADGNTYTLTAKGADFLRQFQGYCALREEVEEQLSDIQDRKMVLENRFLDVETIDARFKNTPNRKR